VKPRSLFERHVRLHIVPILGGRELRAILPSTLRAWIQELRGRVGDTYAGQICDTLSASLNAAVDDGRIPRNPMRSQSVRVPRRTQRKVKAWDSDQVAAVLEAMTDRFKGLVVLGAGCGLRQGELFGVAEDDIDYEAGIVCVDRQVKLKNSRPFFALPKHEKTREVPLPDQVAEALRAHLRAFPVREVELPGGRWTGRYGRTGWCSRGSTRRRR
jgi:integrase